MTLTTSVPKGRTRPRHSVDDLDQIAEVRARAAKLERLCAELASQVADLVDTATNAASVGSDRPPVLLSVQECADMLGLSRTTTFNLTRSGQLASIKVGARRLIPRVALEQFIAPPGEGVPLPGAHGLLVAQR